MAFSERRLESYRIAMEWTRQASAKSSSSTHNNTMGPTIRCLVKNRIRNSGSNFSGEDAEIVSGVIRDKDGHIDEATI